MSKRLRLVLWETLQVRGRGAQRHRHMDTVGGGQSCVNCISPICGDPAGSGAVLGGPALQALSGQATKTALNEVSAAATAHSETSGSPQPGASACAYLDRWAVCQTHMRKKSILSRENKTRF